MLKTKGITNKKAAWIRAITSYRVLEYNFDTHVCSSLPLSAIDNAVVASRRTLSQTSQSDIFIGTGYSAGIIQGNASSMSVTVGDVIFTHSGKNLPQTPSPHFQACRFGIITKQRQLSVIFSIYY